jgi:hypothetical protein
MNAWMKFRNLPGWAQIAGWVFLSPAVLSVFVWSRSWHTAIRVGVIVGVALLTIGVATSSGSPAKVAAPPAAAPVVTTTPAVTTATPVDVTNTTAAVLARVQRTFPKATVSCDGSSGQAVCYVTLNDYLGTIPQTATGATAADVLSDLTLPTKQMEAKALARAKAKAKAKRLAHQRALARAAALRKIGTPVARQQAIESAQNYLDMGGFSRAGLIDQLTSSYGEQFTYALAVFAVDHVQVNWNQQAVESAKSYMSMGGFSRASLIDQLTSSYGEQFTYAQAVYAANKVGL